MNVLTRAKPIHDIPDIKQVAGLFLYLITKETKKCVVPLTPRTPTTPQTNLNPNTPKHPNTHKNRMAHAYDAHPVAAIMRRDPWYRLYLEPRFRDFFAQRDWVRFFNACAVVCM